MPKHIEITKETTINRQKYNAGTKLKASDNLARKLIDAGEAKEASQKTVKAATESKED
jgi:hypothetical protein